MKTNLLLLPIFLGIATAFNWGVSLPLATPYNIFKNYIPSGYMGDFKNIKMVARFTDLTRPDSLSTKVSFAPDKLGWGGVFWQSPANCWENCKGKNLAGRGFTKLTVWVRGEKGGEEVKFKCGQAGDSFSTDEETVTLAKTWTQVSISIANMDLSNVAGAFCWVVDSKAQGGAPVTFYLDDAQFE